MLAGGLDRAECRGQAFPHRIEHRFSRGVALVDRAEAASDAAKARRRLRHVARLLGRTGDGVAHFATQRDVGADCVTALSAMLSDGERRALDLAASF